jgi:hydrogenase maturation protease
VRTLIAGFGNVLRGDDGFGVEVVRRLGELQREPGVDLMEVGTAGIRLAQELLTPYDRLIIVDAMTRGGSPGTVYVTAVDSAKALGALPREVFIVGCEPAEVDELTTALTPEVQAAVDIALGHIRRLLGDRPTPSALNDLRQRDELLQIMFWLHGEGFGPDIALADITRFIDDDATVRRALAQLEDDGYAEVAGPLRYRLTPLGVAEGRRRFFDEFEPYLARHAHGQCGAADCDCRRGGECREPV